MGMNIFKMPPRDEEEHDSFPSESQDDQVLETSTQIVEEIGTTNTYNESYNQEAISSGVPQLPIPNGRQVYPWLVSQNTEYCISLKIYFIVSYLAYVYSTLQASIVRKGKQICTGTLIDNRHVLTTAYCIYKYDN